MILILAVICLVDSFFFPVKNFLSPFFYPLVIIFGLWKVTDSKKWYVFSLMFFTMALLVYLFGLSDIIVSATRKLSDWSFIFLIIGTIQLARSVR